MILRQAILQTDSYTVTEGGILIAVNGSFGCKNPNDYMNKEVKKIRIVEGMYKNVTVIKI